MTGTEGLIPLWFKIAYSLFVVVVVPCYWVTYTPWNFLYFCDIALLVACIGIWIESPLLISMQAVAILLPQTVWVLDFLSRLVVGSHITGITKYMFNGNISLFLRSLSLFHGWLPFVLLWLVWCLGYDRRSLAIQSAVSIVVVLISYLFAPPPPPSAAHPNWAVNINSVYGPNDNYAQTMMAPWLWVMCVIAVNLFLFYLPTHLALRLFMRYPLPNAAPYGGSFETNK